LCRRRTVHGHAVRGAAVRDPPPAAGRSGALAVRGLVRLAQAEVDIVAPHRSPELREQRHLLESGMGAGERADLPRIVLEADFREVSSDVLERRLPVDLAPASTLLQHRPLEPFLGVEALVGKTVAIADPAL